jgi:polysaccharide deacetylase family protein (PEP-CTERM system associated)
VTRFLSFDVEDWFHSHNLAPELSRDGWDEYELRVRENTRRILSMLDDHDTRATFFVLGHVAERAPELVGEIDARGHEVASHGYDHRLLYEQTPEEVREDLQRSLGLLESLTDQPIRGYRAPSFTITEEALDVLAALGFEYDSSHFPAPAHDRYGSVEVADGATVTTTRNGLTEVQLPLLEAFGLDVPWAGGGYFRFIPYPVYRRGVKRIASSRDFVFYLHPWEIDPDQPRISGIPLSYRLRHYTNLERTERRLDRLLADFDWRPLGDRV